ncbi:hypothetical protein [Streptomyces sp. NPDC057939]|uniref:hypothetical protein n=1 Tax=Streptomyces sp. NPDC057939 TaxID=3346284 RepID=UPI0036E4FE7E
MREKLMKAATTAGPIAWKAAGVVGRVALGVLKVAFAAENRVGFSVHAVRRDLDEIERLLDTLPADGRDVALEAVASALDDARSSVAEALKVLEDVHDEYKGEGEDEFTTKA